MPCQKTVRRCTNANVENENAHPVSAKNDVLCGVVILYFTTSSVTVQRATVLVEV